MGQKTPPMRLGAFLIFLVVGNELVMVAEAARPGRAGCSAEKSLAADPSLELLKCCCRRPWTYSKNRKNCAHSQKSGAMMSKTNPEFCCKKEERPECGYRYSIEMPNACDADQKKEETTSCPIFQAPVVKKPWHRGRWIWAGVGNGAGALLSKIGAGAGFAGAAVAKTTFAIGGTFIATVGIVSDQIQKHRYKEVLANLQEKKADEGTDASRALMTCQIKNMRKSQAITAVLLVSSVLGVLGAIPSGGASILVTVACVSTACANDYRKKHRACFAEKVQVDALEESATEEKFKKLTEVLEGSDEEKANEETPNLQQAIESLSETASSVLGQATDEMMELQEESEQCPETAKSFVFDDSGSVNPEDDVLDLTEIFLEEDKEVPREGAEK